MRAWLATACIIAPVVATGSAVESSKISTSDAGATFSRARLAWSYQANHAPSPAFQGGLATWRTLPRVEPIRYDYAYRPVIGGGSVLFASSTEDCVVCLDARTGETQWSFRTDGPVRLQPTLSQGQVYFGSDDGFVYAVDQESGKRLWRIAAGQDDRQAIGNGRLISVWPVRTKIAIADGVAYFGAGLFPPQGTFLEAVDAKSGKPLWKRSIPYSPHGTILPDHETLLVATGRTAPAEFRRSDGEPLQIEPNPRRAEGSDQVEHAGAFVWWGPSESGLLHVRINKQPVDGLGLDITTAISAGHIVRIPGWHLVADTAGTMIYLVTKDSVLAVSTERFRELAEQWYASRLQMIQKSPWRKQDLGVPAAGQLLAESAGLSAKIEACADWKISNDAGYKIARLAGRSLVLGGQSRVAAIDATTGELQWSETVDGMAWGLAVDHDLLVASTDRGRLYAFRSTMQGTPHHVTGATDAASDTADDQTVRLLLQKSPTRKGFCLIVGNNAQRIAESMAARSEFSIIVVADDPQSAATMRQRFTRTGLYGTRVCVRTASLHTGSYPAYFANLIVLDGNVLDAKDDRIRQAMRCLHPCGGALFVAGQADSLLPAFGRSPGFSKPKTIYDGDGRVWTIIRRESLPGAGEWSHLYADPANTVCSNDRLVDSTPVLQWFGPPGANGVVERHSVAMPPLLKNGVLFVAGADDRLEAVDAYNGTRLWQTRVPKSTREMISHNAAFLAASDSALLVTSGADCVMLDARTGTRQTTFSGIDAEKDWGYVACVGERLLGSGQKRPANEYSSHRRREGIKFFTVAKDLISRPTVSDHLFAYDLQTHQLEWSYLNDSVILNSTITVGEETVYFAESANATATSDPSGTAVLADFFASDATLTALDLSTGRPRWRVPLKPLSELPEDKHEHIMFLSYSDGRLLSTRTGHIQQKLSYQLRAINASDGHLIWECIVPSKHRVYAPLNYGKNGQQSHPAIVDGKVYLLSHITDALITIDLATGRMTRDADFFNFWIHSKTCAVPTASMNGLFFRRDSCQMLDLKTHQPIDLTRVTRPSCWMSIIPAGGLILMPEASSGCSCGFALQTSVVFRSESP